MEIKVLGPGCKKCEETYNIVSQALGQAGVSAELTKISDFAEIAKLGVFSTPAVVIDGAVKCSGRVPSAKDVLAWLGK